VFTNVTSITTVVLALQLWKYPERKIEAFTHFITTFVLIAQEKDWPLIKQTIVPLLGIIATKRSNGYQQRRANIDLSRTEAHFGQLHRTDYRKPNHITRRKKRSN
jgi:hypothetical protein